MPSTSRVTVHPSPRVCPRTSGPRPLSSKYLWDLVKSDSTTSFKGCCAQGQVYGWYTGEVSLKGRGGEGTTQDTHGKVKRGKGGVRESSDSRFKRRRRKTVRGAPRWSRWAEGNGSAAGVRSEVPVASVSSSHVASCWRAQGRRTSR